MMRDWSRPCAPGRRPLGRWREPIFGLAGPPVCGSGTGAKRGCLIGYGPDQVESAAAPRPNVAQIFSSASPGDWPIVGPTRYQLAINLKSVRAPGLTVPPALLAQADEVFE